MKKIAILFFVGSLLCLSCSDKAEKCEEETSRCSGNSVQICNSDGVWETIMNCEEVSGEETFTCQQDTDGVHACLPGFPVSPDIVEDSTEVDSEEEDTHSSLDLVTETD